MAITLEELVVLVRADVSDSARKLRSVDSAVRTLERGAHEAGRGWDRGMREITAASERMARETARAGERAAREAVRAASVAAREQSRLAASLAREQEQAARRAETAMRRSAAIQTQLAADLSRSMTVAGAAVVGGLGLAAKTAISFESAFAGVRKTIDASEADFARLEQTLRRMASSEIPLRFEEIAKIAELGGQLGIATKDIEAFTRTVAQLGATTDLSTEAAAEGLARIGNVMKLSQRDFGSLGATIVDLGNNFAAGERQIVEFSQRLAPAARVAGFTTQDILALSAALASVGVEAEAGGTAFSKVFEDLATAAASGGKELRQFAQIAGVSATQFRTLFRQDAGRALTLFIEGLGQLRQQGVNLFPVLDGLGIRDERMRRAVLGLAGAQGLLTKAMERARPAWQEQTALTKESEGRFKTTESQLRLLGNEIRDIGSDIGVQLLPYVRDAARAFRDWLSAFRDLSPEAQQFSVTLGVIGGAALLLGGRILALVSGIVQLRAALAGLGAAKAAAALSGAGAAGAAAAGGASLGVGLLGAGVGAAIVGPQLERGTGGVSLNFGPGSVNPSGIRFQDRPALGVGDLRAREAEEIKRVQAEQAGQKRAEEERRRRIIQEMKREQDAIARDLGLAGARPSVPHFETAADRKRKRAGESAAKRAAREAQRQAEERARNLAAARQDLLIEEMLTRGETRDAFIIQNRRPGVPDALSGRTFDQRQFRQSEEERKRRIADEASRTQRDREEMERRQRDALAETLLGFDTRARVAGLRESGQFQEADFQEFLSDNKELNTLLAQQPQLMALVREQFDRAWGAENKAKVEEIVNVFADLDEQFRLMERDVARGISGAPSTVADRFQTFLEGLPEEQRRLIQGNPGRLAQVGNRFARLDQRQRLAENAIRSREALTDLDQRRRSLLGGEFGAFSVSREVVENGVARQPFSMTQLREQFQMAKQLQQLEDLAGGVRDTFLQAFSDIMTGANGFFSSLVGGFVATFQRIAAEFLASQAMNLLLGLAGSLFGGGGPSFSPVASLSGRGFGIPGRAMGGPVFGGRPYLVGENGPELFVPGASGRVVPNGQMAAAGATSVTIHVHGVRDAESFRKSRGQIEAEFGRSLERRKMRDM